MKIIRKLRYLQKLYYFSFIYFLLILITMAFNILTYNLGLFTFPKIFGLVPSIFSFPSDLFHIGPVQYSSLDRWIQVFIIGSITILIFSWLFYLIALVIFAGSYMRDQFRLKNTPDLNLTRS